VRGLPCVLVFLVALLVALAASACGRTALDQQHPHDGDAGAMDRPRDQAAETLDAPRDMVAEMPADHPPDLRPDLPPDRPPDAPPCVPHDETCNGVDDDCDGLIDEDQPPIPCPGGGARLCIGGAYSSCPRSCQVCVPGSKRTCITSFCTFWGSQQCAMDGMSFGDCRESQPPAACAVVAKRMQRSRALEDCCIANGFCCVDEFDINGNGDTKEMLGRCESITCQ
jgi:hypothetical protein